MIETPEFAVGISILILIIPETKIFPFLVAIFLFLVIQQCSVAFNLK